MIIGVPKEIKNNENRVGMTPMGVAELVHHGHTVVVQHTAGENSGFRDEEYVQAGARILPTIEEVYASAEMIVKVKEPIEAEYPLVRKDQVVFTYFHFAADEELTHAMLKSGAVCIAYETVERQDHSLPLLIPMSEVAGKMAVQEGATYLKKIHGGKGVLLGGVPGVKAGKVLVLGGGRVGRNAAMVAAGMGADVVIADVNIDCIRHLAGIMPPNVRTITASRPQIEAELADVDLVIGAALVPGDKTPHLITRDMLKLMQPGTVLVDVAIDQGGCFETSHPTTHSDPIYILDGIVHYAVANIPGAVSRTSTFALTNSTQPYTLALADKGWRKACKDDPALLKGLNMAGGKTTYKAVADCYGLDYTPAETVLC